MTKKQLEALEGLIAAIVQFEMADCQSAGSEYEKRCAAREAVMKAFSRAALGESHEQ